MANNEHDKFSDILRKAIYLGAGTLAYTQEGMARAIEENLKVPREVANAVAGQLEKGKSELVGNISALVQNYLQSLDIVDLVQRSLHGLEVDVQMKVKFPGVQEKVEERAQERARNRSRRGRNKAGSE